MADTTSIEWTDATWNPITGCSVHSPGCTHCYAMKLAGTRMKHHWSRKGLTVDTKAGPVWSGEVRFNEEWLDQPLRWKRPRMIFVCAHADLFHEKVPDEWIDRIFAVMALCPQHKFQVLTKRADRMRNYFLSQAKVREQEIGQAIIDIANDRWLKDPLAGFGLPLPNIWLGVSVEDQQRADERIPDLLATPAAVRWLSCEPLLGPVNLNEVPAEAGGNARPLFGPLSGYCARHHPKRDCGCPQQQAKLDWVVAGGESGADARPMHPDWARSLRDQCAAAGVPFLFKQWGEWLPIFEKPWDAIAAKRWPDPAVQSPFRHVVWSDDGWEQMNGCWNDSDDWYVAPDYQQPEQELAQVGKKAAGRLLDGVEHNGFPA
jgi:protein gp37